MESELRQKVNLRTAAVAVEPEADIEQNDEESTADPRSPTEAERRAFFIQITSWIPVSITTLTILGGVMLSGTVILSLDADKVRSKLATFEGRLQYTLEYQVWGLLCLVVAINNVAIRRATTQAYNPLWRTMEEQPAMVTAKQLLASSLEYFVCSAVAQLIAIVYLDAEWTLRVIPFMAVTYVIGRIAFWIGYPNRRSPGIGILSFPIFILLGFDLVSFFLHLS